jgi:hypothetical protein
MFGNYYVHAMQAMNLWYFLIVWFYHVRVMTTIKATIQGNENFPSCKNDLGGESQFVVLNFTLEWVKKGRIF